MLNYKSHKKYSYIQDTRSHRTYIATERSWGSNNSYGTLVCKKVCPSNIMDGLVEIRVTICLIISAPSIFRIAQAKAENLSKYVIIEKIHKNENEIQQTRRHTIYGATERSLGANDSYG